ncbi:hypothetical protein A3I27_01905 [Candidatus Giovannonibacteria bacterium RIFCSPLOWO2_02_FULL_43_11b]|uniref:Uncharacterized protein n=1 Tax=Candidatus Giovannonibacteria bacterium RIFCSPHIGHO2_12_FULL_43_15 TaxID=1798341 RepID=A0A1F5WQQ3_9BACT|nr:MAG: hypothetical protein A2739_01905 [Candidatus Giovannonibacteria bacterium RIFCSPHIGHO2_01_FULL_43_100]OGF67829.1 MAG: hypothetical protein A3B97_00935 [Candidatus Giovannonibacteria bacterium RIFCSPHIGHO2_02_FULL_43_32]OGF77989.1 MAG: hypothetical protein A3F23_03290 [Candidatus Giovannonibacteria bacterium RIFCSPHIGHO2_12_FULL_43_15]OGF79510.1 MAG: hypothetical protein A3A15_02155 [Candidatus Giovannonibacteria bacterium RIFCSPLOWO2_01_FULL_43_60]OGF89239.1 MAG: hypothetical protein A3
MIKQKLFFIFIALAFALPVLAQDGSAGLAPSASQPRAATSSAVTPRPINSAPPAGSVTPRPTTATTSAPALATSEPTPKESAPGSNSNILGIVVLAAAVLVLGGYGAYKLKTKSQNTEKKDSKHCFNIKRLMEDKLRELTDLRGQIESKAKEKAREKVRESLGGTSAGEVLAKIERAEKEYAQIKQLYEKCVIEFEKEKVILVDAIYVFTDTQGKIFKEMRDLLEKYSNRKILLTGADDRQFKELGLDKMPYEIWTLKHNPEKTDPEYYKKMLAHFGLDAREIIYFEHNLDAIKSAESIGIRTYFYDSAKKDLAGLKKFLDENL